MRQKRCRKKGDAPNADEDRVDAPQFFLVHAAAPRLEYYLCFQARHERFFGHGPETLRSGRVAFAHGDSPFSDLPAHQNKRSLVHPRIGPVRDWTRPVRCELAAVYEQAICERAAIPAFSLCANLSSANMARRRFAYVRVMDTCLRIRCIHRISRRRIRHTFWTR